jgi:hypothetical protein
MTQDEKYYWKKIDKSSRMQIWKTLTGIIYIILQELTHLKMVRIINFYIQLKKLMSKDMLLNISMLKIERMF